MCLIELDSPELIIARLAEYPLVPPKPTRPCLFAMLMAVIRGHVERRVNDPEAAGRALGISGLGSVEQFGLLRVFHRMVRA